MRFEVLDFPPLAVAGDVLGLPPSSIDVRDDGVRGWVVVRLPLACEGVFQPCAEGVFEFVCVFGA